MTQSETIYFINKKSNTNLIEHKYEFNSYDAYDSNYIVEIKNRRANHKDPFLEVNKTLINLKLAKNQNKQYLYVQQDDTGIYVFNISKLDLNSIYKRFYNVPETTDFGKNKRVDKEFWVLNKSLSTKLELCTKEN
jgi:hypothetical protein